MVATLTPALRFPFTAHALVPSPRVGGSVGTGGSVVGVVEVVDAALAGSAYPSASSAGALWDARLLLQHPLRLDFGRVDKEKTLTVQIWNPHPSNPSLYNPDTAATPEITAPTASALAPYAGVVLPVKYTASPRLSVKSTVHLATTTQLTASVGRIWLGNSWVEGVSVKFFTSISGSPVGVEQRTALRTTPQRLLNAVIQGKASAVFLLAKKQWTTPLLIARTDQPMTLQTDATGTLLTVPSALNEGDIVAWEAAGNHEMGLAQLTSDNTLLILKTPHSPYKGLGAGVPAVFQTPTTVAPLRAVQVLSFGEIEYQGDQVAYHFEALELDNGAANA